jgi:RimJ/RimL family protein N-acetyltransferase
MDHERYQLLPSGRTLDLARSRGDGVLDAEELGHCREHGIPVGYDPVQLGWVSLACEDDILDARGPASIAAAGDTAAPSFEARLERLASELTSAVESLPKDGAERKCWSLVDDLAERDRSGASVAELDHARAALQQVVVGLGLAGAHAAIDASVAESRFGLRPWQPSDVDAFMGILTNRKVWRFLPDPYPEPFTRDVAEQLIEISNAASHHEVRAVSLDGVVIGQVRLSFESHPTLKVAEIAYWLGEEHWGKGLMSELLRDYTQTSFRDHGLDQIYAWIHPENVGSRKAAERAGYARDPWRHEAALATKVRRAGFERFTARRARSGS